MTYSPAFWNKLADKYSKQPIADQASYEKKLDMTRRYLTPDSSVLEFGCGTGSTALLHAPYAGQILATDYSEKMIDIAQQKLTHEPVENVEFRTATIFDLPHPPESFDVVLGLNILHLVQDIDATIAKTHELLKPGGIFVTSTVCLAEKMSFFRLILPVGSGLGIFPTVHSLKITALEDKIKRGGFQILEKMVPEARSCFLIAHSVPENVLHTSMRLV
jgi:2-polyprenyl-3-methyl-5-hydroxy-6-metoxy-1,4-benzoquinol methylase